MFEILREFLMMNLRKKILKKEAMLGTGQEAGDDGVMKMWIADVLNLERRFTDDDHEEEDCGERSLAWN